VACALVGERSLVVKLGGKSLVLCAKIGEYLLTDSLECTSVLVFCCASSLFFTFSKSRQSNWVMIFGGNGFLPVAFSMTAGCW